MILGGYGFFGTRLAELLAANSFDVVIAGRTLSDATATAQYLQHRYKIDATPLDFDLEYDIVTKHVVTDNGLDAVVNTTGPFTGKGAAAGTRLAMSCAASRCHYIDISDSSEFSDVLRTTIGEELQHGLHLKEAIITGASTVSGLTTAAMEHTAVELVDHPFYSGPSESDDDARVRLDVDIGMNPGNGTKSPLGTAAIEAVLRRLGEPAMVVQPGPKNEAWLKRFPSFTHSWNFAFPHALVGARAIGAVATPDITLLGREKFRFDVERPETVGEGGEVSSASGKTSTLKFKVANFRFGAGLESPLVHKATAALSQMATSSASFRSLLHRRVTAVATRVFMNATRHIIGSPNGAMYCTITSPEQRIGCTWLLTATDGDGVNIPILPAAAATKRLLLGRDALPSSVGRLSRKGMQPCSRLGSDARLMSPSMDEIMQFAVDARLGIEMTTSYSMYHYIFGPEEFSRLHPALQRFHSLGVSTKMQGHIVAESSGLVGRLVSILTGTPGNLGNSKTGEHHPFVFEKLVEPFREHWIRHYPGKPMKSQMRAVTSPMGDRQLVEALGPFQLGFSLSVLPGGKLEMVYRDLRLLGIRVPTCLFPADVWAIETGKGKGTATDPHTIHFDVGLGLPIVGKVLSYKGHVVIVPMEETKEE